MIAQIGAGMGLSIWIPRADRWAVLKEWKSDEKVILDRLPLNYDDTTLRTIEQIDVLWLRGRSIVRAFEVEHTTSVYSGIRRMADLLALQPNKDIKLQKDVLPRFVAEPTNVRVCEAECSLQRMPGTAVIKKKAQAGCPTARMQHLFLQLCHQRPAVLGRESLILQKISDRRSPHRSEWWAGRYVTPGRGNGVRSIMNRATRPRT